MIPKFSLVGFDKFLCRFSTTSLSISFINGFKRSPKIVTSSILKVAINIVIAIIINCPSYKIASTINTDTTEKLSKLRCLESENNKVATGQFGELKLRLIHWILVSRIHYFYSCLS